MAREETSGRELWVRAEQMLATAAQGIGSPDTTVAIWRRIVDTEIDPVRRAEAMINLASALDMTGEDGAASAVAISDNALRTLGPKHPQAANAYLMAAQRLARELDHASETDLRKALGYLHLAMAAAMTAESRPVLIHLLNRYAFVAARVGDFSKCEAARRLFNRLRRHGERQDELHKLFGSMIHLYASRWNAESHRPSLRAAIALSDEVLGLFEPDQQRDGAVLLADLQQQNAILRLDRLEFLGDSGDFEVAVKLLRRSAQHSRAPWISLNSLVLALMGSDSHPASDAEFEEAWVALSEGQACAEGPEAAARLQWTEANWHLQAYWRGGPVSHLDSAVAAAEAAAAHPDALGYRPLFTLASTLYERFRAGRDLDDIHRAVETAERGLALCPSGDLERWRREVTVANIRQERALENPVGFDPHDADRANELYRAALSRLPRGSAIHSDTAGTALGVLIEQFVVTEDEKLRQAAKDIARLLPGTLKTAKRLSAIAAMNLAAFHLHLDEKAIDRDGWLEVFRQVANDQPGSEAGWQAASSLMHLNVGRDWGAVLDAFELLSRRRANRLSAAQTSRERAMVLRREQRVAAIAALALVHLGRPAEAAHLIDASQAALLVGEHVAGAAQDPRIWSHVDAILHPVVTRYGACVVTATEERVSAVTLEIHPTEVSEEGAMPGAPALDAAAALLEAAFESEIPERILIVPAGALGFLPWAATELRGARLIDYACVSVLPTRAFWRPVAETGGDLLLVEAGEAVGRHPLRHAPAEHCQLRRWFSTGSDLVGTDATLQAVKAALTRAKMAHFACHGIAHPTDPLSSQLVLEGGVLSVQDVLELDNRSLAFVSLSACQTARHQRALEDEFASLAVAFLASGADCVVGTLWNINDAAASLFSRRMFEEIRRGVTPRVAVRTAQLWLRDTSDHDKAVWLDSLGPAATVEDAVLQRNLSAGGQKRSFEALQHWSGFAAYGCG